MCLLGLLHKKSLKYICYRLKAQHLSNILFKKGSAEPHKNWRSIVSSLVFTTSWLLLSRSNSRICKDSPNPWLQLRRLPATLFNPTGAITCMRQDKTKRGKSSLSSVFIDRTAFDLMDQESVWQWLKTIGILPDDLNLLLNRYHQSYYRTSVFMYDLLLSRYQERWLPLTSTIPNYFQCSACTGKTGSSIDNGWLPLS